MKVDLAETKGLCRWCGCSYFDPCPPGCSWANRQQTLCSACADVDRLVRSKRGRRELVDTFNIGKDASA